jgi:transcriptional regulator GlxA family with amidase domain
MVETHPDFASDSALQPRAETPARPPRRVAMVAFSGVQLLDVVGPLEVLAAAGLAASLGESTEPGYRVEVVGPELTNLRAASGLRIGVDRTYFDRPEDLDTLIVAGGIGSRRAARDARVLDYVKAAAESARRVCSVCTGALILASTGLLDGHRATTHWAFAPTLAERFPSIDVAPDAIYCRDGRFWTSAGVTAGMDLALALVEEDFGRDIALQVSRQMVFFLKRPGGQSQFSAQLAGQLAERDPLRDLQAWIVEHPEEDLSVERLAARVAMSPRHFARVFRAQAGQSPGRYVECVRVEAARRQLEDSNASVEEISERVGLGRAETMRRAFLRQLGIGPAAYRERFSEGARVVGV